MINLVNQRGTSLPLIVLIAAAVALGGVLLFRSNTETLQTPSPITSPSVVDEKVDITASFTIMTDAITRSFKAEKYHNKSPDVFIEALNPAIVHVKKKGITWDDLFKTLPMKLTKDCLITGDGETLCSGAQGALKFYLNDIEDKDLLDREIKEADRALIKFASD